MASTTKLPTTDEIEKIYKVCYLVISNVKTNYPEWQKKAMPMIVFSVIAVLGVIATLLYYIVSSSIVPLMIYMSCAIPILAFGLAQSSKSLESLHTEFTQYNTAMVKLLGLLSDVSDAEADELIEGLAAAISTATTVIPDSVDQVTLGDLKGLPQYQSALILATRLSNISTAISNVKQEGMDVESLLASLDLSETDAVVSAAEDVVKAYQEKQNTATETKTTESSQGVDTEDKSKIDSQQNTPSQTSESADVSEDNSNLNTHIITVKDDEIHEDLTIVV